MERRPVPRGGFGPEARVHVNCLMATHHYYERTGSETYLLTLVSELLKLGHRPYLYAPYLGGDVARETRRLGIAVTDRLRDLSGTPFDVAHVSHNLTAYQVRRAFPNLPMVFVSHGVVPFLEQPPTLDALIDCCRTIAAAAPARGECCCARTTASSSSPLSTRPSRTRAASSGIPALWRRQALR